MGRLGVDAGRADEAREQRMAIAGRGGELRVELRSDEERMLRQLDYLDQLIDRTPGEHHAFLLQGFEVIVVELVAMTVPLHNGVSAVYAMCLSAGLEQAFLGAEAHGAAHVGLIAALLDCAATVAPFCDETDDRVGGAAFELGAMGALESSDVAGVLDDCHLQTQAQAEIRDAVFACITGGGDLALDAALA